MAWSPEQTQQARKAVAATRALFREHKTAHQRALLLSHSLEEASRDHDGVREAHGRLRKDVRQSDSLLEELRERRDVLAVTIRNLTSAPASVLAGVDMTEWELTLAQAEAALVDAGEEQEELRVLERRLREELLPEMEATVTTLELQVLEAEKALSKAAALKHETIERTLDLAYALCQAHPDFRSDLEPQEKLYILDELWTALLTGGSSCASQ